MPSNYCLPAGFRLPLYRIRLRGKARVLALLLISVQLLFLSLAPPSFANQTPSLPTINEQTIVLGQTLSLLIKPTDGDGTVPSLFLRSAPANVGLYDAGNGARRLDWTPLESQVGRHVIVVVASDAQNSALQSTRNLIVNVVDSRSSNSQSAGLQPLPPQTVVVGQTVELRIPGDTAASIPVLYLQQAPPASRFDDNFDGTRTFRWTPVESDVGVHEVVVVAKDSAEAETASTQILRITVTTGSSSVSDAQSLPPQNIPENIPVDTGQAAQFSDRRPVVQPLADQSVEVGGAVIFKVTPIDPDGTWSTLLLDPWPDTATFEDNGDGTRTFFWQTRESDRGTHQLTFTALDANDPSLAHSESLLIQVGGNTSIPVSDVAGSVEQPVAEDTTAVVTELGFAPLGIRSAAIDQVFSQVVQARVPDGVPVPAMVMEQGPDGSEFVDNGDGNRLFRWTPRRDDVGRHSVRFALIDSRSLAKVAFTDLLVDVGGSSTPVTDTGLSVVDAAGTQVLSLDSIPDQLVRPYQRVEFQVVARSPDRPVPLLILRSGPAGSELLDNGDGTRRFSWTPELSDTGLQYVEIQAVDLWDRSLVATVGVRINVLDDLPGTTAIGDPGIAPDMPTTRGEAAQFLNRATFGVRSNDIDDILNKPYEQWINDQFTKPITGHRYRLDSLLWDRGLFNITSGDKQLERSQLRADAFWDVVVKADDQLRQRVAFALSQILVISDRDPALENRVRGFAHYHDILLKHAFGSYRELLTEISLNPMMGDFLSSRRNEKPDPLRNIQPDENYARELMQLFTIGLDQLDLDGRARRDSSGRKLNAYSQKDVINFARVFTGWNYGDAPSMQTDTRSLNSEIMPMRAFEDHHDRDPKRLLNGVVISGGRSARDDLNLALDNLFSHSNVGPFISRQLIQRLVTSNPSPAYIERVASVFNNNGVGSRGDLAAVVKAILMDPEALNGYRLDPFHFGKLKEPIIKVASIWRAFRAQGRFNKLRYADPYRDFAQQAYSAPSVFNFYSPGYRPPGQVGDQGFVAPEAQILNETTVLSGANRLFDYAFAVPLGGDEFLANQHQIVLDISPQLSLASRPAQLVNNLDVLLLSGQMSDSMRSVLVDLIEQTPLDDNGSKRVREALYVIFSSPEFSVQR